MPGSLSGRGLRCRLGLGIRRTRPFLNERRGEDDRKADDEQKKSEGRRPIRQVQRTRQRVDHLKHQPAADHVDPQYLPEGAAVHLVDQFSQT